MPDADELIAQFRKLGVPEPEDWAHAQLLGGIDQLTRATLLVELVGIVRNAAQETAQSQNFPTPALGAIFEQIRVSGIDDEQLEKAFQFAIASAMFDLLVLLNGGREITKNPGDRYVSLAVAKGEENADDMENYAAQELFLHESWGEVAAHLLGKDSFWS